jgi:two-component system response regulator YesN
MKDQSKLEKIVAAALVKYQAFNTQTISAGISTYFTGVDEVHRVYEEAKSVANNGLLKFINSVQKFNGESEIYSPNVLRALNVIHQEYMNNINVGYVSEKLNVSESYLMHMFKDQLGTTFNKILVDTRIREAKGLLKTGEYRVKEVAYKVGFNDEKYFTLIFKKQTGFTPSEFVKKT